MNHREMMFLGGRPSPSARSSSGEALAVWARATSTMAAWGLGTCKHQASIVLVILGLHCPASIAVCTLAVFSSAGMARGPPNATKDTMGKISNGHASSNGSISNLHSLVAKTDYTRWRLVDESGRQTWHYVTQEESNEWPQSIADIYHLGLPTV